MFKLCGLLQEMNIKLEECERTSGVQQHSPARKDLTVDMDAAPLVGTTTLQLLSGWPAARWEDAAHPERLISSEL
jgi:hypothetical protein